MANLVMFIWLILHPGDREIWYVCIMHRYISRDLLLMRGLMVAVNLQIAFLS